MSDILSTAGAIPGPDLWLDLINETDNTPRTKQEYAKKIKIFAPFVAEYGRSMTTLRAYKDYLRDRNQRTVSTKNAYLTAAKVLCRQLYIHGYLPIDLGTTTKGFHSSKKHKKFGINEEEMRSLMEHLLTLSTGDHHPSRVQALFALFIFQGLRQIEVARMDHDDVDLAHQVIYVQGKGHDDKQKIHLHPQTTSILTSYISTYTIASGPLFFSLSNNNYGGRLTTRSIRRIVTDILQSLDISKSTHGFRHYFTTTLLKSFGGDIIKTKAFTRHISTEMLVVYNDEINHEKDLPSYYDSFNDLSLSG